MGILRKHIRIQGRVQGVGFRQHAFILAQKLELTGWVKNTLQGEVEAVIEGKPSSVQLFLEWCHQGPSHAAVARVTIVKSDEMSLAEFERFTILKTE